MKPIYLKPNQTVAVVPMKDEPTIFPFGPIAELIAVGKRPFIVGEICYVSETWGSNMVKGWEGYGKIFYRADMPEQKTVPETYGCPWRSPVTMPAWAARRFMTIISCEPVRVEDISEEDARASGVIDGGCLNCGENEPCGCDDPQPSPKDTFMYDWHKRHPGKEWAWLIRTEEKE